MGKIWLEGVPNILDGKKIIKKYIFLEFFCG